DVRPGTAEEMRDRRLHRVEGAAHVDPHRALVLGLRDLLEAREAADAGGVDVDGEHACALGGETPDGRAPHARGRPGDEDDAVLEAPRHQSAYSRLGLSVKMARLAVSDRSVRSARIFTVSGNLQSQWQ